MRQAFGVVCALGVLSVSLTPRAQAQTDEPLVSKGPCAVLDVTAVQGLSAGPKPTRQHPSDDCRAREEHRRDVHTNPDKSKVTDLVRIEITNLGTCPVHVAGVNEAGEENSVVGDPPVGGETESVESGTIRAKENSKVQAVCQLLRGAPIVCKYEVRVMSVTSVKPE